MQKKARLNLFPGPKPATRSTMNHLKLIETRCAMSCQLRIVWNVTTRQVENRWLTSEQPLKTCGFFFFGLMDIFFQTTEGFNFF